MSENPLARAQIASKSTVALDKEIEKKTGILHGHTNFAQWVEYYSTPMKNCMVAALNLPHFPHQERDSALLIKITHKGDATLPVNIASLSTPLTDTIAAKKSLRPSSLLKS